MSEETDEEKGTNGPSVRDDDDDDDDANNGIAPVGDESNRGDTDPPADRSVTAGSTNNADAEEKTKSAAIGIDDDDDGGGGGSTGAVDAAGDAAASGGSDPRSAPSPAEAGGATSKEKVAEAAKKYAEVKYPLHYACEGGASLEVIRYLVNEGGKDTLGHEDYRGRYPLHRACYGKASLEVIRYLVNEGGKDTLGHEDGYGMYPLHFACMGGASLEVIRYLVNEGGKDKISHKDDDGLYPLHYACRHRASLEVIKYLIQQDDAILGKTNGEGCVPTDYLDDGRKTKLFGASKTVAVDDKPSPTDKLGYVTYAKALAKAARLVETSESSLCVGLYGPWGSGKTTLWRHIVNHLDAEFRTEDAQKLNRKNRSAFRTKTSKGNVSEIVDNALAEVLKNPFIDQKTKDALMNKKPATPPPPPPLPFEKWCILKFHELLGCCFSPEEMALDKDEESLSSAETVPPQNTENYRRDERHALFFSVLELLSFLTIFPASIAYLIYICYSKKREDKTSFDRNEEKDKPHVDRISDLINGKSTPGKGGKDKIHLIDSIFLIMLSSVRCMNSGIKSGIETLRSSCVRSVYTPPNGEREYVRVEFNAWAYSGSDYLWASLISMLWDEVEKKYPKSVVRIHRAKIALAGESPFTHDGNISKEERMAKRDEAWRKYKSLLVVSITLPVLVAIALTLIYLPDDGVLDEEPDQHPIIALVLSSLSGVPLLYTLVKSSIKIFPYVRQATGKRLLAKAEAIESSKRKDFSAEKGFMGEVKKEVEYLFDLLSNEKYEDPKIGCKRSLRLCVFVDDLDRCPEDKVMKVLEAVILLLVDGPITCWLAIDNRVVVECIKAVKKDVYCNAEIHGHEFLDKIVQLPFCLPDLSRAHKKSYLSKMIESNELKPFRVLSQLTTTTTTKRGEKMRMYENYRDEIKDQYLKKHGEKFEVKSWGNKAQSIHGLLVHYHALEKMNHKMKREDFLVIGMGAGDLVETIEKSIFPDGSLSSVSNAHIENFCLLMKSEHLKFMESLESEPLAHNINQSESQDSPSDQTQVDKNLQSVISSIPSKRLNVPMLSPDENDALELYYDFLVGNPRKLKSLINVFNVCRIIFELRQKAESISYDRLSTKDILRFVILLGQWPCRMAWLLQFVEDTWQRDQYDIDGSPKWDDIKGMNVADIFVEYVDRLMYDSERSSELLLLDADPQLFLGLLKHKNCRHLTPIDFLPSESAEHLRDYAFNLPLYLTDKVARIIDGIKINDGKDEEQTHTYSKKNTLYREMPYNMEPKIKKFISMATSSKELAS